MGNRKAATAVAIKYIAMIDPGGKNTKVLGEMLNALDDKQFKLLVDQIAEGKAHLPIIMTNLNGNRITVENNLKIASKFGVELFQRVKIYDDNIKRYYWTNHKYLIGYAPVRRMIEMLDSKISLPDDHRHIDDYSDQPTGVSKGSSISAPESQILRGEGYKATATELVGPRGGDTQALRALEQSIHSTGGASLEHVLGMGKGAKINYTLSAVLAGMHYDNNMVE